MSKKKALFHEEEENGDIKRFEHFCIPHRFTTPVKGGEDPKMICMCQQLKAMNEKVTGPKRKIAV